MITRDVWFATVLWQMIVASVMSIWNIGGVALFAYEYYSDWGGENFHQSMFVFSFVRLGGGGPDILLLVYISVTLMNILILYTFLRYDGHKQLRKGVKEIGCPVSAVRMSITRRVFGKRRLAGDHVTWKSVFGSPLVIFTRRIK